VMACKSLRQRNLSGIEDRGVMQGIARRHSGREGSSRMAFFVSRDCLRP
jgi:hypothetical protein